MATDYSVLAWRIPGTGEPGGLLSMGSHSRTRLKWLSSSSKSQNKLYFRKKNFWRRGMRERWNRLFFPSKLTYFKIGFQVIQWCSEEEINNRRERNRKRWVEKCDSRVGWRDFKEGLCEFQILKHFCPNFVSLLGSGFRMLPTLLLIVEMKSFWLLVICAFP